MIPENKQVDSYVSGASLVENEMCYAAAELVSGDTQENREGAQLDSSFQTHQILNTMPNFIEIEVPNPQELERIALQLKEQWKALKRSNNFSFQKYTTSKINEAIRLARMAQNEHDHLAKIWKIRAFNLVSVIEKIHLTGELDLSFILLDEKNDDQLKCFVKYQDQMSDQEYWSYLSSIYVSQEFNKLKSGVFAALFTSNRPHREFLMEEEDRIFFNGLPTKFKAYRAMSQKELGSGDFRLSWTLDKTVAEFFQNRNQEVHKAPQVIHEMELDKAHCIAYLNSRQEQEIIYIQPKNK